MLRVFVLVLAALRRVLGLTYWGFINTPRGLHPVAGHGLPAGQHPAARLGVAGADQDVIVAMEEIAHQIQGVDATGVAGQSLLMNAYGSNFGTMFLTLEAIREAPRPPDTYYEAIANQLRRPDSTRESPTPTVAVFGPPPVRGVGRAGGFMIMIEDRGDLGPRRSCRSSTEKHREGGQSSSRS